MIDDQTPPKLLFWGRLAFSLILATKTVQSVILAKSKQKTKRGKVPNRLGKDMRKKLFRIYIAVSLDGYIARVNGAVDWLDDYDPAEFDFDGFLDTVGTLIIGRKTFDQVMEFGDWPYKDRRTIVLTSRDLPKDCPPNTAAYGGSLMELAQQLREDKSDTGDIWVVGGASVVTQFLFGGIADQLDVFVIPEILGDGIRLFGRDAAGTTPKLVASQSYKSGVVRMQYDLR